MTKVTLHGSMKKYYNEFIQTKTIFEKAGIDVIGPQISKILSSNDGFVYSEGDDLTKSYKETELAFLAKSASLSPKDDFAYVINPEGYIGVSCAVELMLLLSQQKRIFAMEEIQDPPLMLPDNYVYTPKELVQAILKNGHYPLPDSNSSIRDFLQLIANPLVAVGGIVVDESSKSYLIDGKREKNIGLVQKKERGGQYTLLGGTKLVNETDTGRLTKEFQEQLGISKFDTKSLITSFLEIANSGYRNSAIFREFKDYVLSIKSAPRHQNWVWLPPSIALKELPIEANARKTIESYII